MECQELKKSHDSLELGLLVAEKEIETLRDEQVSSLLLLATCVCVCVCACVRACVRVCVLMACCTRRDAIKRARVELLSTRPCSWICTGGQDVSLRSSEGEEQLENAALVPKSVSAFSTQDKLKRGLKESFSQELEGLRDQLQLAEARAVGAGKERDALQKLIRDIETKMVLDASRNKAKLQAAQTGAYKCVGGSRLKS